MTAPTRVDPKPGGGSQIRGALVVSAAEFTRPANGTAYTAGDVVGTSDAAESVLEFNLAQSPGGGGFIVKAQIWTSQTTNVAAFRLHLFTVGTGTLTIPFDNAAFTTLYAERSYYLGYIDFAAVADGTGTSTAALSQDVAMSFAYYTRGPQDYGATPDTKIYGVLVTETTFTPDSAQTFCVQLVADAY